MQSPLKKLLKIIEFLNFLSLWPFFCFWTIRAIFWSIFSALQCQKGIHKTAFGGIMEHKQPQGSVDCYPPYGGCATIVCDVISSKYSGYCNTAFCLCSELMNTIRCRNSRLCGIIPRPFLFPLTNQFHTFLYKVYLEIPTMVYITVP